jgi:hypothetical protein
MDVQDKVVNLSVHQSRLSQPWDLIRTKLEYPLIRGVPRVDPTTRDYPAARESWNVLTRSTLSLGCMSSLTTRASGG